MDTDLQGRARSTATCDVCPSATCTDYSSTYILVVTSAGASACPAAQYGAADTHLGSLPGSTASCGVRPCNTCTTAATAPS